MTAASIIVLASLCVAWPATISADRGVRVDAGRIAIDEPLAPGQTYHLPTLGVSDPGDEGADYTMQVSPLAGANAPETSWFEFSPPSFDLLPGQTQAVTITMRIPMSAKPGDYTALLAAQIGSNAVPGVGVGAAAAARLTFSVRPASDVDAILNAVDSWFIDNRSWAIPLVAVLGLAVAGWFLRRHLAIEIRRR